MANNPTTGLSFKRNLPFVQNNYVAVDSSNHGYGSCCPLGIHAAPNRDLFWGFEHNTEGNLIARITRLIKFPCRALFWRHRANEPDSAARGHGLPPMQDLRRGKLVSIVKMMTDDDMLLLMTDDYNIETPFSADTREEIIAYHHRSKWSWQVKGRIRVASHKVAAIIILQVVPSW